MNFPHQIIKGNFYSKDNVNVSFSLESSFFKSFYVIFFNPGWTEKNNGS